MAEGNAQNRGAAALCPHSRRAHDPCAVYGAAFGLTVVAQGVETREQADYLRRHACDELQGFYFKRPLPVPEFTQLLREQATEMTYVGARLWKKGP